jgi:uncharacterized protein YjbJ (UPF0337 family)
LPHPLGRNRNAFKGVGRSGNAREWRIKHELGSQGNWKEIKGKVHQQWGKLTNDDLEMMHGKRTELAGRLQHRYGLAKDEAERQIDDWLKTMH